MKKIVIQITTLVIIIVIIASCDFVQNANPPITPTNGGGSGNSSIIYKKVFLEDYTGHKCGNCPAAADVLTALESQYPDKIVPLAIHAGFFAATNAAYPTDFKTTAGNAYDTQFGISSAGNPNGLTNRTGFGSGGFIKAYTLWGSEVSQIVTQAANFQIKINNVFNSGTGTLNTDITVKSLTTNTGNYKLVVLLSEDSIIAEQIDYRLPAGNQLVPNYRFNHVLRGAINSEWGDAVFTGGAANNDSIVKSFTNFAINPSYNPNKCHVIAYIYDADAGSPTHYEVFQVEEAHVK